MPHYRRFHLPSGRRARGGLCYAVGAWDEPVSLAKSRAGVLCRRFSYVTKRHSLASLSVTVITHNEAHNIAACLRSVSFADQVVVLDSGSTDDTVQIARSLKARLESADRSA
jgi:hypothetical protein